MSKKITYFPQALLLKYAAMEAPKEAKKGDKVTGLVQSALGVQNHVPLAKLKGDYIPEAVLSKVYAKKTGPDMDKYFMSLENHKISSLTPEIRLYRRSKDNNIVPFYFPVVSDYDFEGARLNLKKTYSSNSATIENFSVTYTGKNPYTAERKFLEASLTVNVDNISTLFNLPKQSLGQYAPLADLFTIRVQGGAKKTPSSRKTQSPNALGSGTGTNIVAVLGYANHQTDVLSSREMKMIEENRMIINLYYSNHQLSIQQDGSATVNISYTGFLHSSASDIMLDLITPKESKSKILLEKTAREQEEDKKETKRKISMPLFSKGLTDEEKAKAKAVEDQEVERVTIDLINDRFRSLFDSLYANKKIHFVPYIENFKFQGPRVPSETGEYTKKISGTPPMEFHTVGTSNDSFVPDVFTSTLFGYREHYITIGDFLDAYFKVLGDSLTQTLSYSNKKLSDAKNKKIKDLMRPISEEIKKARERLKKLIVLMCDIKYSVKVEKEEQEKKEGQSETEGKKKKATYVEKVTNIADIPMAVDTLYSIVYDEMISTRKFWLDINSFLTSLLTKILNSCFGELPSADFIKDVDFVVTNFTGKPCANKIKKGILKLQDLPLPNGDVSTDSIKDSVQYFVIHQKPPSWTAAVGSGNKESDLDKGIFHIRASQDRGLVKSISFSAISQPARQTYMIFRNGQMYDELRYPHNATVEMFGNNLFMPMSLAYINPDTLGFGDPRGEDSIARRLGFGGYYVAERVTTTYSQGSLSTSVYFHFNAFPELPGQDNLSQTIKTSIKELTRK